MDHLWSPWRFEYVSKAGKDTSCVFCGKQSAPSDDEALILLRARHNFIILNLYPYSSGHLMVVPFEHVATLGDAAPATTAEMMELCRLAEISLTEAYRPTGINLGMNLGNAAGAGVAGHIHMHVLPRWSGDVNFMTTIGETRVLPEDLQTTYRKLRPLFQRFAS